MDSARAPHWWPILGRAVRYCRRRWKWTPDAVAEMTQIVALRLLELEASGVEIRTGRSTFSLCIAWLRGRAMTTHRRRTRIAEVEQQFTPLAEAGESRTLEDRSKPHEAAELDWAWQAAELEGPRARIHWALGELLGMSDEDVTAALGSTPGSHRTQVAKVRTRLREAWARETGTPVVQHPKGIGRGRRAHDSR